MNEDDQTEICSRCKDVIDDNQYEVLYGSTYCERCIQASDEGQDKINNASCYSVVL